MADPDPDRTARAQAALARVAGEWMSRPGVVSVEVARRRVSGQPSDEVGIRVTISPDAPPGVAAPDFPETLDGVPVDVVSGRAPRPEGSG